MKNAVDTNSEDAEAIIKAAGLSAHAGIMTLVFDEHKFPYRVPIACINEPASFMPSDIEKLEFVEKPEEEVLKDLKVRAVGEQDYEFETSNYTLVSEIKIQYLDATDKSDYDLDHCILLYGGRKLENQLPLYSIFNAQPGMVFQ